MVCGDGARLRVTYGTRASETAPTQHECTLDELDAWLRSRAPCPGDKDGPWLCFAAFDGQRSLATLQASYAVPLDFDTHEPDLTLLAGYAHFRWTTHGHQPHAPRWRVVVPVDRPMSAAEHRATWECLAAMFPGADPAAKDASRLNYLPGACLVPQAAQYHYAPGALFPVCAAVDVPAGTTRVAGTADDLTAEPVPGWDGPTDDDQLIAYMRANRRSAEDAFGTTTRFEALWTADAAYLAVKFPHAEQGFDHTKADAALANELAYYTGGHGERCAELFARSALAARESWRPDKARRAILLACTGRTQYAFMRQGPTPGATPRDVSGSPVAESSAAPPAAVVSGPVIPDASHFYAYLPNHDYIHRPTGLHWPAASLDSTIGKDNRLVLDVTHPVHLLSWAPGLPERFLYREMDDSNTRAADSWVYNEYQAPSPGRAGDPSPWLALLNRLYPDDAEHIIHYFAHAVQFPGVKCNHALVLGSAAHGIGKDTLLKPLRRAVGARNYAVIEPKDLFGDFNPWVASVVVQISESRNVGDGEGSRISKYDIENKVKNLAAAPPATLMRNCKHVTQNHVRNVLRLIITTNHGTDGIYIDAEDRRHYCAWSTAEKMSPDEFKALHDWLDKGGCDAVAAFLESYPLDKFNPGAEPRKTEWWHRLVLEGNPQDDNPLEDAIAALGNPPWITAEDLKGAEVTAWLADMRNRKGLPRTLAKLGYTRLRNPLQKRGRFNVKGQQRTVYARAGVGPEAVG